MITHSSFVSIETLCSMTQTTRANKIIRNHKDYCWNPSVAPCCGWVLTCFFFLQEPHLSAVSALFSRLVILLQNQLTLLFRGSTALLSLPKCRPECISSMSLMLRGRRTETLLTFIFRSKKWSGLRTLRHFRKVIEIPFRWWRMVYDEEHVMVLLSCDQADW